VLKADSNLECVSQELSYTTGLSSCQVWYDRRDSIGYKPTQPAHHTLAHADKILHKNHRVYMETKNRNKTRCCSNTAKGALLASKLFHSVPATPSGSSVEDLRGT